MTAASPLLALLLGALAWYGRARPGTAGRLNNGRPAPLAKPATPLGNGSVGVRGLTDGSAATQTPAVREGLAKATEEPQPPATLQPPAISLPIVDDAQAPDAQAEEIDAVVPSTPAAAVRTIAPAADPAPPPEPAAAQTLRIPAVTAEQEHDGSGRPETAATAPAPTPRPLTPTESADAGDSAPHGGGSARSLPDGLPPGPDYPIKGNAGSMLFHPPTSPYYKRTKAEVWFRTADDARAAGFTEWTPRKRATH